MRTSLQTDFFSLPIPRVVAHRGGAGVKPENTLEAFADGYAQGVRYFELDIHSSRDDVLVVCHDPDLGRTTDLSEAIRQLSYAQIARADAGFHFAGPDGGLPFRGMGMRVPGLIDVLGSFADTFFIIEVKQVQPSVIPPLHRAISSTGTGRRVFIASEHQEPLDELRALEPRIPTNLSANEVRAFLQAMAQRMTGYHPPGDAIQVPPTYHSIELVSAATLAAAHQVGIEMHVWTINEAAEMRAMLELGVDGILTDFPARLLAQLRGDCPPVRGTTGGP